MVLVSNYAFLLRVIVIHIVLLGIPFMPPLQLILLILSEIIYFISSSGYYLKKKHIRSLILLLPKIWQSLYLLAIEVIILTAYLKLEDKKNDNFGKKTQKFLVNFIVIGTIAEYFILAFNITFMIYTIYLEKKVLKTDARAAEKIIKSKEFFLYLENMSQLKDSKVEDNGREVQEIINP